MTVEVAPVRSAAHLRAFCRGPQRMYRNRASAPRLPATLERRTLVPRTNPELEGLDTAYWVARRSGAFVGRISATVYPTFVDKHGPTGFFGHFECEEDPATAAALLDAARSWLRDRAMRRIAGPFSHTGAGLVGFVVEGHDERVSLLQPYTLPYYADLVAGLGFTKRFAAASYRWTAADAPAIRDKVMGQSEAVLAKHRFRVRPVDLGAFEHELDILRYLYNRSFVRHPDSTPLTKSMLWARASELKPFIDPRTVTFIETEDGRPIGFNLMVPDLYEGFPVGEDGWNVRKTARALNRRSADRGLVVAIMGADPSFVGAGVGRVIAAEIMRPVIEDRASSVTTTWIHEKNTFCHALARRPGIEPAQRYLTLEADL